jgi:methionine sulfoxide reductase heme-binding subunit
MSLSRRALTYAGLCAWTAAVVAVTRCLAPVHWKWTRVLSLSLGYVGASGIAAALAIGPVNVALRRRIPVSMDFRRDVGIWSGVTILAHVCFGLQVHRGGRIREYFFAAAPAGLTPRFDGFGVANHVGAAATLLVAAVLLASNDFSLHRLGARRWKALQRLTYPVFALMAVHSWIYQWLEHRAATTVAAFTALFAAVCVMQVWGSLDRRSRPGTRYT